MQTARSTHFRFPHPNFKPLQIGDIFRYLDWMSVGLYVLIMILSPRSPEALAQLFLPHWICYVCLAGLFGLSLVLPQQWKVWQRRLYILTSFSLILLCLLTGWGVDLILYILIAKACFLVSRQDLAIFLVFGGGIWTGVQAWVVYQFTANYDNYRGELGENQQGAFLSTAVSNTGLYIVASTFVLLMSVIILQEQRSRAKAEQLAAEVEILAATVERSRIAREIHDSLGHRLTTLDVQLELAQKLQTRDPDRAQHSIDIAKQLAHQCLQDVRHAVHSMANQSFDLNQAVQTLLQPLQANPELKLETRIDFPVTLPATLSHQIYCIIQEGLTNIQRHSKATKIQLQSYASADHIHVKLSDNGIGFNFDQASQGFGLRSMNERAQLIGGNLTLSSLPNHGTQIDLTIPQSPIAL
jgi:signal transduction histidine kinase